MQTIAAAAHTAYLDVMTGEGLLVLPHADDDLGSPLGVASLHEADWNAMLRTLDHLGWEPTEGEGGDLCAVGEDADGRTVVGLYGREPITSEPRLDETEASLARLAEAAHLGGWRAARPS